MNDFGEEVITVVTPITEPPETTADGGRPTLTDREQIADRLLQVSAEHSFDPLIEIDWRAPLSHDQMFLPAESCTLYGTDLWNELTARQRCDLTRHEAASMASVGIWFEIILMRLVTKLIREADPRTRHVQYALTEIADECRHSTMFARLIEKLEAPAYGPGQLAARLGRVLTLTARPAGSFGAILIAEEILDAIQRQTMRDESVAPLVRDVCRIHVIEESRHVRYAREELARLMATISPLERAAARYNTAVAARVIAARLVHPAVYAHAGIDPRRARAAVRASQHRRDYLRRCGARLVAYFDAVGLLRGGARGIWRATGLV